MNGSDWFYLFLAIVEGLLSFLWRNRFGLAVLLVLILLGMIANNLAVLGSLVDSMAGTLDTLRKMFEARYAIKLPDANAIHCPVDSTECRLNYCLQSGECGFL